MFGAEAFTKVPVAIHHGFWQYASDARAELSQPFGLVFLFYRRRRHLVVGCPARLAVRVVAADNPGGLTTLSGHSSFLERMPRHGP
jgi:hypothetical protein